MGFVHGWEFTNVIMHHCRVISGIIGKAVSVFITQTAIFGRFNVTHLIYAVSRLSRPAIKNFAQRFL